MYPHPLLGFLFLAESCFQDCWRAGSRTDRPNQPASRQRAPGPKIRAVCRRQPCSRTPKDPSRLPQRPAPVQKRKPKGTLSRTFGGSRRQLPPEREDQPGRTNDLQLKNGGSRTRDPRNFNALSQVRDLIPNEVGGSGERAAQALALEPKWRQRVVRLAQA